MTFALFAMIVVFAFSARRHDAAERDFWASLYRTARAQFLQRKAEERRTHALQRRAYAEAKSDAVQTVMRYVCHELRNPLHGIMVRRRGGRARTTHKLRPCLRARSCTTCAAGTARGREGGA